jgi:hypothetical protein
MTNDQLEWALIGAGVMLAIVAISHLLAHLCREKK